ncbi:MAG: metalloregulator ArsR/SmtB family transcription factor [Polyangia bacterium]
MRRRSDGAHPGLAPLSPSGVTGSVPPRWELYRVLAEPVRLRLLSLVSEEELAIGELAELLGESQPNVSRHVAPLRQAGLVKVRRQGTRALLHAPPSDDVVITDAVRSGRALCEADGSLARVAEVLRARDALTREYFEIARSGGEHAVAGELGAYLLLLAPLLSRRALAVDAGTGDGGLLDVLAPLFERVVAVDRSAAQLAVARVRVQRRGYKNVELVQGELRSDDVQRAVRQRGREAGADAVFAVRLLHHAPQPERLLRELLLLCAPGAALLVLDYAAHGDERMRERADLWLGFAPEELRRLAEAAGGEAGSIRIAPVPPILTGDGPDHHLPWQLLCVQRPGGAATDEAAPEPGQDPSHRRALAGSDTKKNKTRNPSPKGEHHG